MKTYSALLALAAVAPVLAAPNWGHHGGNTRGSNRWDGQGWQQRQNSSSSSEVASSASSTTAEDQLVSTVYATKFVTVLASACAASYDNTITTTVFPSTQPLSSSSSSSASASLSTVTLTSTQIRTTSIIVPTVIISSVPYTSTNVKGSQTSLSVGTTTTAISSDVTSVIYITETITKTCSDEKCQPITKTSILSTRMLHRSSNISLTFG